jgi:hypothetical protein
MSTTNELVPPELWNAIPLAPVRFRRLVAGVALAVLAPFAAWGVQKLGVVRPNIEVIAQEASFDETSQIGTVRFHIRNSGRVPFTVERVTSRGLNLQAARAVRIAAGTTGQFEESFTVSASAASCPSNEVVHYQAWTGRHAISTESIGVDLCRVAVGGDASST